MMVEQNDLMEYLSHGIEQLIADLLRTALKNPKETSFFLKYRGENARNTKTRQAYEDKGMHIPPFLIASITTDCNLFCKGCYARANGLCGEQRNEPLSALQWKNVFGQANNLGISFCLLAGGEPLLRRDVLEEAAKIKGMIFPVFTNGTLFDTRYIDLFDRNRNLIPILSLEGTRQRTDERRGQGAFDTTISVMEQLKKRGILFGVSLTVTTENVEQLTSRPFLDTLVALGSKLAFYVSFVPVEKGTEPLAPTEAQRLDLERTLECLRQQYPSLIFLSFPGDEQHMGGCLAAGRGFFHINAQGAAEACPFAPYSDRNLRTHTLLEVLQSPFFKRLKDAGLVGGEHDGGCTLFQHEAEVKALLME